MVERGRGGTARGGRRPPGARVTARASGSDRRGMGFLRSVGSGAAGLAVFLVGGMFVLPQVGLFVGGISYRKDCAKDDGRIVQDWEFSVFAPIPYLFRPDDPNCVVHTGTRVALDAVGIGGFEDTTPTMIAEKFAARSGADSSSAYLSKLGAATAEYAQRNESVQTVGAGLKSLTTFESVIAALDPPSHYADAHRDLLEAIRDAGDNGQALAAAAKADDKDAYDRAAADIDARGQALAEALQEFDRLRATE